MDMFYHPHMDREIESLIERIHPPRVCIDNDSCRECTVVKVDSANKHGILLEMVQVLTDLDLIISRSYISSDGGWFMDVFHVTDQSGKKLTDETLMLHIQQELCNTRRKGDISSDEDDETTSEPYRCEGPHSLQNTALEMTGLDRPGLLSELAAVLADLGCTVTSGMAWTHNDRAACIIYVEDALKAGPIKDPIRLGHVQEQLQNVVEAHGDIGERKSVRLRNLAAGRTHTERRLHQLMYADRDYESCRACHGESSGEHKKGCDGTHVSVSRCKDKGYWVVNVRSRDRPKLLFDTVCVLTDLHYVVFHAAIRSKSSMADQEYFIKHDIGAGGSCLDEESERQKLILCLIAAIERRVSHGLRVDIRTKNRMGLLSNVTRVFRENGLSVSRVEIGTQGDKAVGSFFVTDCSGQEVNPNIAELVRQECGGTVVTDHKSPYRVPKSSSSSLSVMDETTNNLVANPIVSIGNMLWSQIERLSGSFGSIRS